LLRFLIASHGPVGAIGLTGQMHGIVYLNEQGQAISPLYTWQDGRGDQPHPEGGSYADVLSAQSGYALATGFGSVTHFYNQIQQLVPEGARCLCTIHGYIGLKLTGRSRPLLHSSDAAGLGMYDDAAADFDREALQICGLDPSLFPEVTAELDCLGETGADDDRMQANEPDAACLDEISRGIPVFAAIGDNQASFIGSVGDMAQSLLINIGTSGQISFVSDQKPAAPLERRPLLGRKGIVVGSILSGGNSYAMLEAFYRSVLRMAGCPEQKLYEAMNQLALDFDQMPDKLVVDNRFYGTRQNPMLRGSIENIGKNNWTAQHLTVGILEGIVQEIHNLFEGIETRPDFNRLIGSGNALRHNKVLQRMLQQKFGLPMHIPAHREEAAYGAALCALTGNGFFARIEDAQKQIRYEESK
jgi:sedoheptulokinase